MAEPRYRSYKTEKRSVEDDYSRQKYPSKADSVDFSEKTKTLLARHSSHDLWKYSSSPRSSAIDNASTIQGIFCQSNFAIIPLHLFKIVP